MLSWARAVASAISKRDREGTGARGEAGAAAGIINNNHTERSAGRGDECASGICAQDHPRHHPPVTDELPGSGQKPVRGDVGLEARKKYGRDDRRGGTTTGIKTALSRDEELVVRMMRGLSEGPDTVLEFRGQQNPELPASSR